MLPSVALSIGSRTRQRSRKPGKNISGISTYLQIRMVQHSFSRQHLLMTSSKRDRGTLPGVITSVSLTNPLSRSLLKILPYFLESKGWKFSMPQKEMLQELQQTNLLLGDVLYLTLSELDEKRFSRLQRRTGQTAIQTGPSQHSEVFLQTKDSTNQATPVVKQSPSKNQYIKVLQQGIAYNWTGFDMVFD